MAHTDDLALQALDAAVKAPGSDWYRANCPFCVLNGLTADRKRCWGFLVGVGYWHCFRCHTSGMIGEIPALYQGTSQAARSHKPASFESPEGYWPLGEYPGDSALSLSDARHYLSTRVPQELWKELKIGAAAYGTNAGRVIVPVLALDGVTWLGWVGRGWVDRKDGRTYKNATGMSRDRILFNEKALHTPSEKPVYVVEGVFDAIALWPDGVAVLGKPTAIQINMLVQQPRPVVVILDGDAFREAEALAMKLRLYGQAAGSLRMPAGVDPDEVPRDQLEIDALQTIRPPFGEKYTPVETPDVSDSQSR